VLRKVGVKTVDRGRQINLMENAEARTLEHIHQWVEKSEQLKALLFRRDREKFAAMHVVRKKKVAAA
jgi:hypothetical protein